MAVGDIYTVDFQYTSGSREFSVNFGYEMTGGTDVPVVAEILARNYALQTSGSWLPILGNDVFLQCAIAYRVNPGPSIPGVFNYPTAQVGLQVRPALPATSCLVAKFVTDNVNPKHNGRKYISGISDNQLLNGLFSAAFIAGPMLVWTISHAAIITASGPDDQVFEPVVINRQNLGVPIIPPTASNVVSVQASPVVFRQRRRLTRRTAEGAAI